MTTEIAIGSVPIGGGRPPVLIAGPRVMEDAFHLICTSVRLGEIRTAADVRPADPDRAPSDGSTMLPLVALPAILAEGTAISRALARPV